MRSLFEYGSITLGPELYYKQKDLNNIDLIKILNI